MYQTNPKKARQDRHAGYAVIAAVVIILGCMLVWHKMTHNPNNYYKGHSEQQSNHLSKNKTIPSPIVGTYMTTIPMKKEFAKYYQIVSVVHLSNHHIYQQLLLVNRPKPQPKTPNKYTAAGQAQIKANKKKSQKQQLKRAANENPVDLSKGTRRALARQQKNRRRTPKRRKGGKVNAGVILTMLAQKAKRPTKNGKRKTKFVPTPVDVSNDIGKMHLRPELKNMNEDVTPYEVTMNSSVRYTIKLKMSTRVGEFTKHKLQQLIGGQYLNKLLIQPARQETISITQQRGAIASRGTSFKKISSSKAKQLFDQSGTSTYWGGY